MDYQEIQNLLNKVWPGWKPKRRIGKGSFGTVYEIRKVNGNMVDYAALKIISIPEDGAAIPMGKDKQTLTTYYENIADGMVQEYDIMSRLKQSGCENVVACDSYVKVPNSNGLGLKLLIQMELLTDLNTYTRRYGFSRQNVIRLGIDICKALESCKAAHVIHRDIKPANLFVSADGVYKLGDFGVAKRLEETGYAGSKQGTILYMAPEVYANQAYDTRADIYSLGLVMYQLMNRGELPFDTGTFSDQEQGEALRKRMRGDKIPMPAEDGELGKIVCCACEYNYWDRYSTPGEMRRALEKLLNPDDDKMLLFPVDINNEIESEIRIRFMSDEGKVFKEDVYQSGQQVVPPKMVSEIEVEGIRYQFMGWEPSVPEKAIDSMECKAVYKEVESENQEGKVNKKRTVYAILILLLFVGIGFFVLNTPSLFKKQRSISEQNKVVANIEETEEMSNNEPQWSEWVIKLPKNVKTDKYDIEEKLLYRSRELKTTSSTEKNSMKGWELYDTFDSIGEWGEWSNWSSNEISPDNTREVETKKQYRYRNLETTVSEEDYLDGWELNDITYSTDGWGAWSSWAPTEVSSSDTRDVQSKMEYRRREIKSNSGYSSWGSWSSWQDSAVSGNDLTDVQTRTLYPYYYYYCPTCGRGTRWYTYGGTHDCGAKLKSDSLTIEWFENPWSNSQAYAPYGSFTGSYAQEINGATWWNYDKASPKTQYRYRTRTTEQSTSYGSWSDWSDEEYSNNSNWEIQTRYVYRYRDASNTPVYHFVRWGSWSDWSDSVISGTKEREVEEITQYRYREQITKTIYYFRKWSEWSEYTDKKLVESDTLQVEGTIHYRYRLK